MKLPKEVKERLDMIERGEVPQGYKQTPVGIIPEDWKIVSFEDFFKKINCKHKIEKRHYLNNGLYPIIDQGQSLISGYYNDKEKLLKTDGIIVFGDHTRAVKFVDFNFIIGADGVQLLKTQDDIDLKFGYYELLNKQIINLGYSRHFKVIKEFFYTAPPLREQEKIGQVLSAVDKNIDLKEELIKSKKEQKKGLMQRLLTGEQRLEGFAGEWKDYKIKDAILKNVKIDSVENKYLEIGNININNKQYILDDKEPVKGAKKAKKGAILISTVRPTRGAITKLKENIYVSSALAQIYVNEAKFNKEFIYQILNQYDFFQKMGQLSTGTTYPTISNKDILSYQFVAPAIQEQTAIANILETLDKEINLLEQEFETLKEQKKALMQLLLTGIMRVEL